MRRPPARSLTAPRTGETSAFRPTLAMIATLSRMLPSRSPNRRSSVSHRPIAPDTTAKLKIVFAKSYRAQPIGTIGRPDGVSPPSPPRRPPDSTLSPAWPSAVTPSIIGVRRGRPPGVSLGPGRPALYDRSMTATDSSPIARDARSAAAIWRPQRFSESGGDVNDPIIEPLWTGLRVLALVDGEAVTLRDLDGDAVGEFPDVALELAGARRAEQLILDGYLTHQVLQERATIARREADAKSSSNPTMSQMWFGNLMRRNRRRSDQPSVEQTERAAPVVDGDVALVVVDILWLDDEPLLDVPLLERKRVLESALRESRLIRQGTFVRPPVDPWLGSWRSFGFSRMSYKAANSRYFPGRPNPQWTVADVPAR